MSDRLDVKLTVGEDISMQRAQFRDLAVGQWFIQETAAGGLVLGIKTSGDDALVQSTRGNTGRVVETGLVVEDFFGRVSATVHIPKQVDVRWRR